jgi:hypothetical protein
MRSDLQKFTYLLSDIIGGEAKMREDLGPLA